MIKLMLVSKSAIMFVCKERWKLGWNGYEFWENFNTRYFWVEWIFSFKRISCVSPYFEMIKNATQLWDKHAGLGFCNTKHKCLLMLYIGYWKLYFLEKYIFIFTWNHKKQYPLTSNFTVTSDTVSPQLKTLDKYYVHKSYKDCSFTIFIFNS